MRSRTGAIRIQETGQNIWMRLGGLHGSAMGEHGQLETDHDRLTALLGANLGRWTSSGKDEVTLGAMAGYGTQDSSTTSNITLYTSDSQLKGYGLGLYANWLQDKLDSRGWYVDAWLMLGRYDAEVNSSGFQTQSYDIDTTTASLETGYAFNALETEKSRVWFEPQAQLIWTDVDAGSFVDDARTRITSDGTNLTSRLGVGASMDRLAEMGRVASTSFVQLDWLHALERPNLTMDVYEASFGRKDALRVSIGHDAKWSESLRLNLKFEYTGASGGGDSVGAHLGFNYRF